MRRALALATLAVLLVAAPAGAAVNDFACKPTEARPVPVVVLHGTFGDSQNLLGPLRTLLDGRGYCVFVPDYGNRATAPIDESADEVAAYVRRVLEATGARRVSFVGHSQGGMLGRYVAKSRGLLDRVDDVVGLAPSSHGTQQPLAPPLGMTICPACGDQVAGSDFMQKVNAGEEAPRSADVHSGVDALRLGRLPGRDPGARGPGRARHERAASEPLPHGPR